MPTIARFSGIVIRMYFLPKEHNPPHVHVVYKEGDFSITIKDCEIIDGEQNPPAKILNPVKEWIVDNKEALQEMWDTQTIQPIEPKQ
jgi:hypothetical protein